MLYVRNTGRYACEINVVQEGRERKYVFDRERRYSDTGAIATTGVTPIADKDYEWLYENCKEFSSRIDSAVFIKQKSDGATDAAQKMDTLEKENQILREQLAEKTKAVGKGEAEEEIKEEVKETKSLKSELESTKKTKKKA